MANGITRYSLQPKVVQLICGQLLTLSGRDNVWETLVADQGLSAGTSYYEVIMNSNGGGFAVGFAATANPIPSAVLGGPYYVTFDTGFCVIFGTVSANVSALSSAQVVADATIPTLAAGDTLGVALNMMRGL